MDLVPTCQKYPTWILGPTCQILNVLWSELEGVYPFQIISGSSLDLSKSNLIYDPEKEILMIHYLSLLFCTH